MLKEGSCVSCVETSSHDQVEDDRKSEKKNETSQGYIRRHTRVDTETDLELNSATMVSAERP